MEGEPKDGHHLLLGHYKACNELLREAPTDERDWVM